MTRNLADKDPVFLDVDSHVVPHSSLLLLSSLSSHSLESLANAAASELTTIPIHTFRLKNVVEQPIGSSYEAYAAMCTIVATCARAGNVQTSIEQRQQLYVLGVQDKDLQLRLTPVLAAVVPRVRRVLETTNFDFAQVVDVSWRLDYVLRSSSAGSVHEPLYFVQLQLQSPRADDSGLQTVTFTCSVEELRVLVYRIQEAANEVEKLVAGAPSQLRTSA
ncbi:hypothetical protein KXD40_008107 [Peronospora effusa]|nr:hypothetical protein KXD40_008107 [Peronospora effusa]CAI5714638.1 unnamed protein product [Peronospora effusa]